MKECVLDQNYHEFHGPKLKKKKRTKEEETIWLEALLKDRLEEDSRPGIPDIKQVELFSKWRKFVP